MIVLIQCLRIERGNGLEINDTSQEPHGLTSSSNSIKPHGFFAVDNKDFKTENNNENNGFPTPSSTLPEMVKKAKEFARHYLSSTELKRLRILVQKNRENGTETEEIRRIVVGFLNNVLNKNAKHEINQKRKQLQRDFGNDAILHQ
uniref:Uncharacterized protein n=1 Tax=Panagrolaimus sp. ES5 TaxID=591445 RepID=A0AC34F6K7_9BILA